MAVMRSPPATTTSVGDGSVGSGRVWDAPAMVLGPMVKVWPETTAVVVVGPRVKEEPPMMATEEETTTGTPPMLVLVGSGR